MRDDQERLIRLALLDQNKLLLDENQGRGGYLHRNENCWRAFVGRKSHYRAFRAAVSRAAKEQLIEELKARLGVSRDG
jgi:predicted RNA-binding protein YlxR (DUF448 family)